MRLCRCGADVIATDLKANKKTDDVLAAVRALGRRAHFIPCDVRDRTSVDDAVKEVEK